jgi:shikimate kinase
MTTGRVLNATCVVVMGPKAVGKSWVADVLERRFDIRHLDSDALILELIANGAVADPARGWLRQVEAAVADLLLDCPSVSVEATGAWDSDWLLIGHLRDRGVTVVTVWVSARLEQSLARLETRGTRKVPTSTETARWYYESATRRAGGYPFDLIVDTSQDQDEEALVEAWRAAAAHRISAHPTEFADLNAVLRELTHGAITVLGDNLVGAYLQGSFALGDADQYSDVDFLIPTRAPITPGQEAALRALHASFPARAIGWAKHLEGSYPPADELRTLAAVGRPWLYVDNGASQMEWSTHCNSAVTRWILREHGVILTGPEPKTLVDPVSAADLRAQVHHDAKRFIPLLAGWADLDNAWTQPYVVATFCRFLHTLDTGLVSSKREAMTWARHTLDPQWSDLIQQALDDRPDPWERAHQPARADSVEPTRQFALYATDLAAASPDPEPQDLPRTD